MSSQLRVDYNDLFFLEQKLTTVLGVIGNELESTVVLSAHCGDARLGGRVIDFGQSWNKHRFEIRDTLEWLRDSVKNIATQLEEVDATLASGLTGSGSGGNGMSGGPASGGGGGGGGI